MAKVFITGSEGSLMQVVIPLLLEKGHKVCGIDSGFKNGKDTDPRPYRLSWIDMNDRRQLWNIMKDFEPDYVIQAAARIYGVSGFHENGADILNLDIRGHSNVLEFSEELNVKRVHYISSSMVYESVPGVGYEYLVSDHPPSKTDYGLSKYVGERLCKAFKEQYDLNYTIWRPFNIITPSEKAEVIQGYSHVFADFFENIVVNKMNPLPIIGDGTQVRCFTNIKDVARGIADNLENLESENNAFNLGTTEAITMKELAQKIWKMGLEKGLLDSNKPLDFRTTKAYPDDVKYRVPNVDRAKALLNWEPTISLNESLEEIFDAFQEFCGCQEINKVCPRCGKER